jgi:uncharacterized protein (DUF1015 family)
MDMTDQPPLVRPFVAERFVARLNPDALISPPYDVISPQRRAELARDEHNIVHLILPEGQGDRYAHAAAVLNRWRSAGVLEADPEPTVSILRQTFTTPDGNQHERTGIVVAVTAEPYAEGRVRPHERTHRGPKEDRLALLRATHATLEPLLFMSRDADGRLRTFLEAETQRSADSRATLDGAAISLWVVPAARAGAAIVGVGGAPLYIADGHHRYETAGAHAADRPEENWTLGMIVATSDPGLVVLPTHRVIVGGHLALDGLKQALPSLEQPSNGGHDCIVVWPDGEEKSIRLPRAETGAEAAELLVARVERLVVAPLLSASGGKLVYTHDVGAARELAAQGGVAVLVNPTPVDDVLAVADAGGVMPPKSTFFYPKVPSGLLLAALT